MKKFVPRIHFKKHNEEKKARVIAYAEWNARQRIKTLEDLNKTNKVRSLLYREGSPYRCFSHRYVYMTHKKAFGSIMKQIREEILNGEVKPMKSGTILDSLFGSDASLVTLKDFAPEKQHGSNDDGSDN